MKELLLLLHVTTWLNLSNETQSNMEHILSDSSTQSSELGKITVWR